MYNLQLQFESHLKNDNALRRHILPILEFLYLLRNLLKL